MPSFEGGFVSAVMEFALFLVLGVLLGALFGWVGALLFLPLSILSFIEEAGKMKYWSTSYLIGYLIAQGIIVRVMPDPLSITAIAIGIAILFYRIMK